MEWQQDFKARVRLMSMFPKPPEIFNQRYELLEYLGSGGVGTVFRALQIDAEREIALKVMHREFSDNDEFKQRFIREARALSQLSHKGIVTVYHIGVSDTGLAYMAMELLEGKSLRHLLNQEERIPSLRALEIVMNVAEALAYVHKNGIVHRDLKPENIIIVDTPEPDSIKLIDFGLARMSEEQKLTQSGVLIGTVSYMSPEQCKGKIADARSDIYSLCACLYEMFSGEKLYESDNPVGVMYKHMNDAIPQITGSNIDRYDDSINSFFRKGLAKGQDDRFQTMEEVLAALSELYTTLEQVEAKKSLSKAKASKTFSPRLVAGLVAALLAVLISVGAYSAFLRQQQKKEVMKIAASAEVSGVQNPDRWVTPLTALVISKQASHIYDAESPEKAVAFLSEALKSKKMKPRAKILLLARRGIFSSAEAQLPDAELAFKLAEEEYARGEDTDSNHLFFACGYLYASSLADNHQFSKSLELAQRILEMPRLQSGTGQSRLASGIAMPMAVDLIRLAARDAIEMHDMKTANQFIDKLKDIDYGGFRTADKTARLLFQLNREKDVANFIDLIDVGNEDKNESAAVVYEYEASMDYTGLCAIARDCRDYKKWDLAERALRKAELIQEFTESRFKSGVGGRWQYQLERAELLYARGLKKEADAALTKLCADWLKYNKEDPDLVPAKNNPLNLILSLLQHEHKAEAAQVMEFVQDKLQSYCAYMATPFLDNITFRRNRINYLARLQPYSKQPEVNNLIEKINAMPVPKIQ